MSTTITPTPTEHLNFIHEYIRNKKNKLIGVVVAALYNDNQSVYLGWSKCKLNAGDRFNKEKGLAIALARAHARGGNTPVPSSILPSVNIMGDRAKRYFKDKTIFAGK